MRWSEIWTPSGICIAANGFRDVEVTSRVIDDYNGATAHIAIFIDITEGPQWFVSKLDLAGRFR